MKKIKITTKQYQSATWLIVNSVFIIIMFVMVALINTPTVYGAHISGRCTLYIPVACGADTSVGGCSLCCCCTQWLHYRDWSSSHTVPHPPGKTSWEELPFPQSNPTQPFLHYSYKILEKKGMKTSLFGNHKAVTSSKPFTSMIIFNILTWLLN